MHNDCTIAALDLVRTKKSNDILSRFRRVMRQSLDSEAMIPVLPGSRGPAIVVNGIYKLRAHAHRRGGSMGAYGTSQGGGGLGGRSPPPPA